MRLRVRARAVGWSLLHAGLLVTLPAPAAAWCQSLSIVGDSGACDAPCLRLEDFSPREREERGIVALSWRQPCVEWSLDPAGTPDLPEETVRAVVERSFDRWLGASCTGGSAIPFQRREVSAAGLECPYPDHQRGVRNLNLVTFVPDWTTRAHSRFAFAITTTHFDVASGEILGADLEVNDETRRWAVCPDGGCRDGRVDLENVVVHELGHFFGLSHTVADALFVGEPRTDRAATMWACADEGETLKRDLAPDDEAGFCALYAGLGEGACSPPAEPPFLTCGFVGDECQRAASCPTGLCLDLGDGPRCTLDCTANPSVCGPDATCEASGARSYCVPSGCGCAIPGQRGDLPAGPAAVVAVLLAGALVSRRRRRRPSRRTPPG